MNGKPTLSIVIVSYNVKDLLLECLASIHEFAEIPHEVIVIDNNSADGTCMAIKEKFQATILIENQNNAGFSAANNQGFAIAKGKFILMLNPDARLIDNSLKKAIEFLENAKDTILLGPRIFNPDGTFQASAWKFPNVGQHFVESIFLNRFIDLISYSEEASVPRSMPVDFVSGAAILVRKETMDKLRGLDENLFWMDDTDLCYRNEQNGGETIYFPQWQLVHHIGQSSAKNLSLVISNQVISKLKFYKKHKKHGAFFIALLIFKLHIILRLIFLLPVALVSKNAFAKWKAYAFTSKKLFRYLVLGDRSVA